MLCPVLYWLVRRLHAARSDRRHRLPEQGRDLRSAVQGGGRGHAHHRRRSQAPRRPHRHHRRAPHLGLGDDASSARAHDRAGRRLSLDGERWISSPARLLPAGARALAPVPAAVPDRCSSRRTRPDRLTFFGDHAALAEPRAFAAFLAPLRKTEWVVYAKQPFGGPQPVLRYLSRYTHRVAISNRRLVAADDTGVTFSWKDYRIEGPGRYKTMTLPPHEFIRRFLMHVLPKGFHRIRHYGLFANGNRADNIARARELLAVPPRADEPESDRDRRADEPRVLPASLPLLRRPHDHHRDLRARLRAASIAPRPLRRRSGSTPHDAVDRRSATAMPRHSRRLSAGNARARVRLPPHLGSTRNRQATASPPCARPARHRRPLARSDRPNPCIQSPQATPPRPNPHSARCTAAAHLPRFRALALFGRRPRQRVDGLVMPASENLHKTGSASKRRIRAIWFNSLVQAER